MFIEPIEIKREEIQVRQPCGISQGGMFSVHGLPPRGGQRRCPVPPARGKQRARRRYSIFTLKRLSYGEASSHCNRFTELIFLKIRAELLNCFKIE
jgi:hypothetical protein